MSLIPLSPLSARLVKASLTVAAFLTLTAAGCQDADGDGYTTDEGDCDDGDPFSYPGAEEACDGYDNDCDDVLDEGLSHTTFYADADGDGYGVASPTIQACDRPAGYATDIGDCDDSDFYAFPGAAETCDSEDDDCDGRIDEDALFSEWYRDADGDGYGVAGSLIQTCTPPAGYAARAGDCNDSDFRIYPSHPEQCGNGRDDDCSGADEDGLPDSDGDTIKDGCERCPGGDDRSDSDGDGLPNACEGVNIERFPQGDYFWQSAYGYTFTEAPYVLSFGGRTQGISDTGYYSGQFEVQVWANESTYNAGNEPDCIMTEALTAFDHPEGSSASLDYDACVGCDPISDFYSYFVGHSGCTQAMIDFWYYSEFEGRYEYELFQNIGYRHAATDGWPSEFDEVVDEWVALGYEGVLYDTFVEGTFAPQYFTVEVGIFKQRPAQAHLAQGLPLTIIPLHSPSELRSGPAQH